MSKQNKLLYASHMAAAIALAMPPQTVRARTMDGLMTYDQATIDSSGAFLIGELERLDQTLNMPLADVTWGRDIQLREDVTIADEVSSFTNTTFAAAGSATGGKNWIGKDTNAVKGLAIDIGKTAQPLTLWGMEIGYSIPELESAMKLGRPIDAQKIEGMELKRQMDIDEQVYIGDTTLGYTGLVNSSSVDLANVANGNWGDVTNTTADEILADINALLSRAWKNSGYAICPTDLLLPPLKFGILVSRKVSDAGNISVLEYVKQNCLCMAKNGRPLNIKPVKWLEGAGAAGTDRMVAYTNDKKRVRFPLVPVQRTPLEYRSIMQLTTYFCRLGVVEWVYPETGAYADGI